jgi:hypothetical protein
VNDVSTLTGRLRSLLIALAVLALSATAALAGRSALSAPGGPVAAQHEDADGPGDEAETATEEPEVDEADQDAQDGDADTDAHEDAGVPEDAAEHPDNHGKDVSGAATGETPDGVDHHGAFVRSVATDNDGHQDALHEDRDADPDADESEADDHHADGGEHRASHESSGEHHDDDDGGDD